MNRPAWLQALIETLAGLRARTDIFIPTRIRRRQGGWVAHRASGMRTISLTISSNQAALYDIQTAAGTPTRRCRVIVTINAGVVLQAGLRTGTSAWPAGTPPIKIVSSGTIAGVGGGRSGSEGDGGGGTPASPTSGANGAAGGDAIALNIDVIIDNTSGNIFGGGGEGGGGGAASDAVFVLASGGGAGGGQGYNNAAAGHGGTSGNPGSNGSNGSSAAAGGGGPGGNPGGGVIGGKGGDGGSWGTAGTNGDNGTGSATGPGGTGGAAGKAIALNGKTVTWLGGNNAAQVKGAVA